MPYLLFFLSGAGGLIYEVVWVRQFGNVFGNSVYSASLVTAVFMLGLGVGGYAVGRWADRRYATQPDSLLRTYGYFELSIAAIALVISLILPHLGSISATITSYSLDGRGWHVLSTGSYLARSVVVVVLLAPITLAMGGTLTLLIRHLVRKEVHLENRRIALLYGANTLGAALGAFLTDFALVPAAGYFGTQLVAAALNVATGLGALVLASGAVPAPVDQPAVPLTPPVTQPTADVAATAGPRRGRKKTRRADRPVAAEVVATLAPTPAPAPGRAVASTGLALAMTGFAAMGMEILWFRHFTLLLGGFRAVFSLLLTIILLGTGAGSLLGNLLIRRTTRPAQWLIAATGLFVASTLVGLAAIDLSSIDTALLANAPPDSGLNLAGQPLIELWLNVRPILIEVGVPALLMGLAFPLGNAMIQRAEHAVGGRAGVLYLANTIGAACGVLVAGFLLLPGVGMQRTASILMVTGGLAIVPLLLASGFGSSAARLSLAGRLAFAGMTALGALALAVWLLLPADFMILGTVRKLGPDQHLLALSEGINEVIAIKEVPGEGRQLITDGHPMSFTNLMGQRYMHALADIPLLLVDKPGRILVIGFGVGNTAYAASLHPTVHQVEVADLSAQVLDHAGYFRDTNHDVLSNRRVAVYVNDGRQHLRMLEPASYDVIALEPPPLALAGIGALYSKEFYTLARTRLKPKGYLSQWLPVYQVPPETLRVMIRAFLDVFPQAVLLGGTDEELLLVGANDEHIEVDPDRLAAALAAAPAVQADLQRLGLGSVREIVSTFVASSHTLAQASQNAQAESDDRPIQEYSVTSRLGWAHENGLPPWLVDLGQIGTWCPRCFESGTTVPTIEGLDANLALLGPLYTRTLPPAQGAGSVDDPTTARLIHESPYLQELLALHASRHNERGGALAAAGKFDEAIAEFRDGLRLKPDSAPLFWNLGRAIVARGGPATEAIIDLRRAVELDPSQGAPHYDLGSTLLDLHRYDEAIDEFRAAVALMPTSVEAHNNLGIALGSTGKLQEAIAEFQLAVKLNPENTEARHNLDSALQAVGAGGSKP